MSVLALSAFYNVYIWSIWRENGLVIVTVFKSDLLSGFFFSEIRNLRRASESSWKITIICRVYSPPLCKLIYTKINISYTNTKLKLWCYFLKFRNIRNFTNSYIQQKAVKKNQTHTVMTAKKAAHTPRRLTTLAWIFSNVWREQQND